jgi:hypothetical protein
MDRRSFVLTTAGLITASGRGQTLSSVSVTEHGADASGKADSTSSLRAAIASLKSRNARRLYFPNGVYRLTSAQRIALEFTYFSNLEIDGGGATLILEQDTRCMSFSHSANVTIHDLAIDYDPLPFTQGTVTESGANWFTVRVDAEYPTPANREILAISSFDRTLKVLSKTPFIDIYPKGVAVETLGPTTFRVQLDRSLLIPVNTALVLRFKGVHDAVGMEDCNKVTFQRVTIHSSYSAAMTINSSRDLKFDEFKIGMPVAGNRLLSTNADGIDFNNCTGSILLNRCALHGTGDDAINSTTEMWRVTQADSGTKLVKRSGATVTARDLSHPTTTLTVVDPAEMKIAARGRPVFNGDTLAGVQRDTDESVATTNGALVFDPDLNPAIQVIDSEFTGNRGRALILHKDVLVRNCTFRNTSLSAILLAPDLLYREGPFTTNVVIESNHFFGCYYGSPEPDEGSITIAINHSFARRPKKVVNGQASTVTITDNVFESCATAAIACTSVDKLVIKNNEVGPTWTADSKSLPNRAIFVSHITNSEVSDNRSTVPNAIYIEDSDGAGVNGNIGFQVVSH